MRRLKVNVGTVMLGCTSRTASSLALLCFTGACTDKGAPGGCPSCVLPLTLGRLEVPRAPGLSASHPGFLSHCGRLRKLVI